MSAVEVITGARLHFGLLCGEPSTGWHFGGIGLMVDSPGWHLQAAVQKSIVVDGAADDVRRRLLALLPDVCEQSGLSGLRIVVRKPMPLHMGLGAGTQLALAGVTAALVAAGKPRPGNSFALADRLNRAGRSGIGTFGFDRGGFLIDEGRPSDSGQRVVRRIAFPEAWRMVLVFPPAGQGLHGAEEEAVFDERLRMPFAMMESQRQLIEDGLCPALEAVDLAGFRTALFEYGQAVGEFFSGQQGGVFSSSAIAELCRQPELRECGAVQSSWGPTVAIPVESQAAAEELCRRIEQTSIGKTLPCWIAAGQNQGATVRTVSPDQRDGVVRG